MKWKRLAFAASQPYAAAGPRSSSVPSRCSDWPGRATHFGSGCWANSTACSAFERNALAITRWIPARAAAAAMRSKARATSGRIGLPWRWASGPRYSPAPTESPMPPSGGASSATATRRTASTWARRPGSTRTGSRTAT